MVDTYDLEDISAVSVLLSDLVRRSREEEEIGINLPAISERHGTEAEVLWMEMDDVEEVLKYVY
ncbi:hypothetical protein D3C77_811930 [compost metagenome]